MDPDIRLLLEDQRNRLNRILAKANAGGWVGDGTMPNRADIPAHIAAIRRAIAQIELAIGARQMPKGPESRSAPPT
jgi:hypothetical protein